MLTESADLRESSSAQSLKIRLQETLTLCSKSTQGDDSGQTDNVVSELVYFLDSVSDAALSDPENDDAKKNAYEVLREIYKYLSSASLDQEVIDVLSFKLPKAVSMFAGVSDSCLVTSESIIDWFIEMCNPRDMLPVLCEALSTSSGTDTASHHIAPLLSGLSKVFLSIKRCHFEQVKEAVPVILDVLKAVCSESDDGPTQFMDLFDRTIKIAGSIHAVCVKLECNVNGKLRALLGLYVLYIMAIVSVSWTDKVSSCLPLVSQLSHFLPYCSLSYLGLITGSDVDQITSIIVGDDDDDVYLNFLSYVKLGSCVSVIWGFNADEVAWAANENLSAVKDELRSNRINRWQAVGMLKHIFSSINLPWDLKKHTFDFLLCIMDGNTSHKCSGEHQDNSIYMPTLFAALQAITLAIIYTPETVLRKNAYEAFKKVLADIPTTMRFDILQALITNCDSSSMIAVLIDLVRDEMCLESLQRKSVGQSEDLHPEDQARENTVFWTASVLELVELILKPPKGAPPSLPEFGDAVLSALNLYRFTLLAEASDKTNYTGVMSKNSLQKAYNEWLLPLRTLVIGVMAENNNDYGQFATDIVCALNPVELVLYRCIELVEEKLRHPT
ncbi:hypothetical protein HS088_TW04G00096 [Tripterygium wilfordii]|uniref:Aberrant root formation protein 4 n=1 Tax=Tripterygium wilfordii TaxID=458696 RepID=A0A7J7DPX7_TRIWF|nr:aberrant root formation protein 4 [Tripterygium wilfordii]KAF5748146.1 hypothetical protein HS088_TW04G00096 [Tripterygium wilfordii]